MLICQLTDLHLCPPGVAAYRKVETNTLAERAFRAVAALRPAIDVLLITGDLAFDGQDAEYQELMRMLRGHIACPVYVIPGNHDRRVGMREQLAGLPGLGAHPHFIQYAVEDFPARLVMLDTLVPGAPHGELCDERLAWLDETLAAAPAKPTMLAMHHPPFATGVSHMDRMALRAPERLAAVLGRHKQVQRIICGHVHRPVFADFAGIPCSIAPATGHQIDLALTPGAPGAFTMEPPAAHLHSWSERDGFVTNTAYVEAFPGPYPFASASHTSD